SDRSILPARPPVLDCGGSPQLAQQASPQAHSPEEASPGAVPQLAFFLPCVAFFHDPSKRSTRRSLPYGRPRSRSRRSSSVQAPWVAAKASLYLSRVIVPDGWISPCGGLSWMYFRASGRRSGSIDQTGSEPEPPNRGGRRCTGSS